MATETERKFLVNADKWAEVIRDTHTIDQGYIVNRAKKTVRVRTYDEKGFITIKGKTKGITRPEFEYEIPLQDAKYLLSNFCNATIKKLRHKVNYHNNLWEVDEFLGQNKGLLMAEIELTTEDQKFDSPGWLTEEVTHDERYYNAYLVRHPFTRWK